MVEPGTQSRQGVHHALDNKAVGALDQDAFELKRMMRQQAHEQAFEILVKAQRNFENEKDKEVKRGIDKENAAFQSKIDTIHMNSKIALS